MSYFNQDEPKVCNGPGCYLRGYTVTTQIRRCLACGDDLDAADLGWLLGDMFNQRARR